MSYTQSYQRETLKTIGAIPLDKVDLAIEGFKEARAAGRGIFICGNGGSAANASHFACEVLKGASYGRAARFRIQALTDSMPTITAYANDVGYEAAFVEQLKNFAQPGDIVVGLSGSGNSMSVVRAIEYANSIGCRTLTMTGYDGGKLAPLGELSIHIAAPHIGRSEEAQLAVLHMISYYFMDEKPAGEAAAGE